MTASPIQAAVVNAADSQASIDVGVPATLRVTLTNRTGAAIAVTATGTASTLTIYGTPPSLFTAAQLAAMTATMPGWEARVDHAAISLVLTAARDQSWPDGGDLVLVLDKAVSTDAPGADGLQINPAGLGGAVPLSVSAPLILKQPKKPGNASLTDVLQVNLDNQGVIYRSAAVDPLVNVLLLNIKNVSDRPVYRGKTATGSPQVRVRFVYGSTAGALAPATNEGGTVPAGSAWRIRADPKVAPIAWAATNPDLAGSEPVPSWTLSPSALSVLGTDDLANVTFAFSDIVSFTPPGHTQMYVLFTGFAQDETTPYDDHVFILDLPKVDPPPTRGLAAFSSTTPLLETRDPTTTIPVTLRWTMFDVARTQLIASLPTMDPCESRYPAPKPLAIDSRVIDIPPVAQSQPVFFSLQSFDGGGGFLNALQFTVYVRVWWVCDPAGRPYRVALFGDTCWTVENYAYAAEGSFDYGPPELTKSYGRLYTWDAARALAPAGWRLPSVDDWRALFQRWPSPAAAFAALIASGGAKFDAALGGYRDITGSHKDVTLRGVYWAASDQLTAHLSTGSGTGVTSVGTAMRDHAASVRYVRHI